MRLKINRLGVSPDSLAIDAIIYRIRIEQNEVKSILYVKSWTENFTQIHSDYTGQKESKHCTKLADN